MIDGIAARSIDKVDLAQALVDAHAAGWRLLADLAPAQWQVPYRSGINPPLWELAHVAWFTEWWTLRQARPMRIPGMDLRAPSAFANADSWLDSSRIAHRARWDLPLPASDAVKSYCDAVLEAAATELVSADDSDQALYLYRLALFHADMHNEALTIMRQSLGYGAPAALQTMPRANAPMADVAITGGASASGRTPDGGFSFDNELGEHAYEVEAFAIGDRCVNNAEFARFVEDGGYAERRFWSEAGWQWLKQSGQCAPVYWRRQDQGAWEQLWFGTWRPLPPDEPACHVNAHEAEAYCRWSKRRLPTEREWEYAAANKLLQWGHSVWEWTADPFLPYPGFTAGPYRDYSQPWFGDHRVLRGGSFATHGRMHHPRYRNFYLPERNDIFAGFRTCALAA